MNKRFIPQQNSIPTYGSKKEEGVVVNDSLKGLMEVTTINPSTTYGSKKEEEVVNDSLK